MGSPGPRLAVVGAVLLVALHALMLESTGEHQHVLPAGNPELARVADAVAHHVERDADVVGVDLTEGTGHTGGKVAACLAILAVMALLGAAARSRRLVAPKLVRARRPPPILTPEAPPPIAWGVLQT